eukprot:GHVN01000036.1.p1 GENE.GHVN01000036.1~~GHVN01000036.1.p1  ORF type:complete len:103 (+),score=6.61 GHVN01000036.1:365-673(+)
MIIIEFYDGIENSTEWKSIKDGLIALPVELRQRRLYHSLMNTNIRKTSKRGLPEEEINTLGDLLEKGSPEQRVPILRVDNTQCLRALRTGWSQKLAYLNSWD